MIGSSDMPKEQCRSLAALIIAAIEGAVIMSMARRSIEPIDQVQAQIARLLPEG